MPDHILELVAEEYLEFKNLNATNMTFCEYLKNWLLYKGYNEYLKFV